MDATAAPRGQPAAARARHVPRIVQALRSESVAILSGARGLGQPASIAAAAAELPGWQCLRADGRWLQRGYLAGFHEWIDASLDWCDTHRPALITQFEQSLKRLFPHLESPHFHVPKDLTNTASAEERTRFYHHEYQNKLLVGLHDFLCAQLDAADRRLLLVIEDAQAMSPTARSLLAIFLRDPQPGQRLRCLLVDHDTSVFIAGIEPIHYSPLSYDELNVLLGLDLDRPEEHARRIHACARGNQRLAEAVIECERAGISCAGTLDGDTLIALYLASRSADERHALLCRHLDLDAADAGYIAERNHASYPGAQRDAEHLRRHERCMAAWRAGNVPLVVQHANAILDKHKRLRALAEPAEILKSLGLYDTWFSCFADLYGDAELRRDGTGDEPVNAAFINAAFVLYALGCSAASVPLLEQFREDFPHSKFIPTVLYAQAMTYGRYQRPVNLPLAEHYATLNLHTIDSRFRGHEKYQYIKVFAENAYAYIKARQGRFDEALALCLAGNETMHAHYGERFKLHQSILIYNTSQVFELVGDDTRAEVQLRLAIEYDPCYGEYWNDLGNLLSRHPQRAEEALGCYERALMLCPPYPEAHLNRGVLRSSLGQGAMARADFARCLQIRPQEWRAWRELGNLDLVEGRVDEALDHYRAALAIERHDADLHCNAGLAWSEAGNTGASLHHYRLALQQNPRHPAARHNLKIELMQAGAAEEMSRHAAEATFAVERSADGSLAGPSFLPLTQSPSTRTHGGQTWH